jgi:hypothetical protein
LGGKNLLLQEKNKNRVKLRKPGVAVRRVVKNKLAVARRKKLGLG